MKEQAKKLTTALYPTNRDGDNIEDKAKNNTCIEFHKMRQSYNIHALGFETNHRSKSHILCT